MLRVLVSALAADQPSRLLGGQLGGGLISATVGNSGSRGDQSRMASLVGGDLMDHLPCPGIRRAFEQIKHSSCDVMSFAARCGVCSPMP
jgi:hypothetical protein